MPPRRRAAKAAEEKVPDLVIGVIGIGNCSGEEIQAQVDDLLAEPKAESAEFIFALTNDALGDGAWTAFDYVAGVKDENPDAPLTIAAVTDPSTGDEDAGLHEDAEKAGARTIAVVDSAAVTVADELVKAKSKGADARLVVFWVSDEDENTDSGGQYAALETADQGGVKAFNICKAMDDLTLGTPEPETPSATEPEEPPRRSRRGRAAAEPEAAPAAEEKPASRRGRRAAAPAEEPVQPTAEEEPADEAQAEVHHNNGHVNLSDTAVGDILNALTDLIADKVAKRMQSAASEEAPPRRGRR